MTTKPQSILFSRAAGWTPTSAREWLVEHGYVASNRAMEVGDAYIRVRQANSKDFTRLRTIHFGQGIKAIVGPRRNGRGTERPWLDLSLVLAAIPAMEDEGVSAVARSPRGFIAAYKKARGDVNRLGMDSHSGQSWRARRNAFVARHLAQMKHEPRWVDGQPTRRHLALIAWAYSPDAAKVRRWLNGMGD